MSQQHYRPAPDPAGRRIAAGLATMNTRAVVDTRGVGYLAVPRRKPSLVRAAVAPRFQPRSRTGQFVTFLSLREAVNNDYAMTAFEADLEDEADAGVWFAPCSCAGCSWTAGSASGDCESTATDPDNDVPW